MRASVCHVMVLRLDFRLELAVIRSALKNLLENPVNLALNYREGRTVKLGTSPIPEMKEEP